MLFLATALTNKLVIFNNLTFAESYKITEYLFSDLLLEYITSMGIFIKSRTAHIHTYTHTHRYIHTYTQTRTHTTYIYTQTHTSTYT